MSEHKDCDDEDIEREIQGIGIKTYSTRGDCTISFKSDFTPDMCVDFPVSKEEEIIITYRDKCLLCGEYVGYSYNLVYKYESVYFGLNLGEYNGRIHIIKTLEDINEIDEAGLDPTLKYIYIELSNYMPPFDNTIKIYIQKSEWNRINDSFMSENKRPIGIGDNLYNLVIDKQNRVINFSYNIPKLPRDEVKE